MLQAIPTLLVTCEEPGLVGCAALAHTMADAPA
jgi:glucokinase